MLPDKRKEWLSACLRVFRRPPRGLILALAVLTVEAVYVFIVSAGKLTGWPTYHAYLNYQAEGFRAGHLHLSLEPPAALLVKPNPFDPANQGLWYWDASLFKGHYYLYWGPVPALLLAGAKVLFRIKVEVGDQYVVFALTTLQLVAGTLLIARIARRLFAGLPTALVAISVVAVGFANPSLYNLARAGVYEAGIVGGNAFLVSGLVFAFDAVSNADVTRNSRRDLVATGVCWALALGSRVTIAPAIALLILTTGLFARDSGEGRWRDRIRALLYLSMPVALGVGALLAYNKLRFEDWLDFGRHFQLSWIAFAAKAAFIPANLYTYALRPLAWSCRFPFLFALPMMGDRAFPRWFHLPPGYGVLEQVAGVLAAVPWSWLWIAVITIQLRSWWPVLRGRAALDQPMRALGWSTIVFAIAALLTLVVELPLYTATMRYLGDAVGGIALGGALGAWLLYDKLRRRAALRRLVIAGCASLMLATVGIGVALGIEGQYQHFRQHNSRLLDRLEARWSVCRPP